MAVPFNDLRRRYAGRKSELLGDIERLLDSGILIGGAPVSAFERDFAAWCGVSHIVGCANGTDALELALKAVGVQAGDEVVCVANAGGYATVACLTVGARPAYVDILPETLQLDPSELADAVSPATKAVIVTHLYGWMNDVEAIRAELVRIGRGEVAIVEDCAQAHGASRGGKRAGSLGDVSAFSFYPTKNMGALGDAGCVATSDPEIAKALTELRQYGWSAKYAATRPGGRNSRLDPIQALGLSREIALIDHGNERRRAVCRTYRGALPAGWSLIGQDAEHYVGHLAVLVAPDPGARDTMRAALQSHGIGTDIHYPILDCDQEGWRGQGRVVGDLADSRAATNRILTLPCFPELTDAEIGEVAEALNHGR